MMKQRHSSLYAGAAIAAALAFGSTPASAQFADTTVTPFPVVPEVAPPPAPAPVMTSSPVVQAIPEPAPAVERADQPAVAATRTTTRAATPRSATTVAAPAPIADVATPEPVAVTPVETTVAAPLPVTEPAAEPAQSSSSNGVILPAILGGLAVLFLAIWGFIAIGRRKPVVQRSVPQVERPVVQKPVVAQVGAGAEPVLPPLGAPVTPTPIMARSEPTGILTSSLAHGGSAVALPRSAPVTFVERNALLDRMIAARPDRANPFTAPLQRRKRAKLILQSLGRTFDVEPWIDLSQYPQNWPELARRQAA